MDLIEIKESTNPKKKLMAVFKNKKTNRTKTIHFGSKGNKDFTIYSEEESSKVASSKRKAYIARHQVREDWTNPFSAGALSRYILWEKKTIPASITYYKKKFKL
tara:strand:- start:1239 stop:1550 length:312 start_codon:yes stop_codon:yes gene_type:complete